MAAKPVEVELIPTLSSLEPVYGEGSQLDEARLRFARLGNRFEAVNGARPALFARSPGRCLFSSYLFVSGVVTDFGPAAVSWVMVQGGSI
jgi:hypothetical protein